MPAINLDKLWTLVTDQTREKYKNHPEKKVPIIDVVRAVSSIFFSNLSSCTNVSFLNLWNLSKSSTEEGKNWLCTEEVDH